MMPKGWEHKTLEDIADFENGQAHETLVDENGPFILINSKFVSSDGQEFKRVKESLSPLSQGDIALVMSDIPNGKALAKCFLVQRDNIYTLNQRIGKIKAKQGIDSSFLRYAINRNSYFLQFDSGVGQTNLRKSEVLECPLLIPPLAEQKKIAEILSTWDRAIEQIALLRSAEAQKTEKLLEELFAETKEGVTKISFSELVEKYIDYRGRTPLKLGMNWGDGTIKALSANNVQDGYIDFDRECNLGSESLYSKWMTNGDCAKGDVVFTMEAPLGNVAQIPDNQKYILSQRVLLIRPKPDLILKDFLAHLMRSPFFKNELVKNASGTTATGIQRKRLDKILVSIPPIEEQIKIESCLNDQMKKRNLLSAKLNVLLKQKQGLMQKLLTGKVRVKV